MNEDTWFVRANDDGTVTHQWGDLRYVLMPRFKWLPVRFFPRKYWL